MANFTILVKNAKRKILFQKMVFWKKRNASFCNGNFYFLLKVFVKLKMIIYKINKAFF